MHGPTRHTWNWIPANAWVLVWGIVIGVEASATPARHVPDHVARHSWGGMTVETAQGGFEEDEATITTEKARRRTEDTNIGRG